MISDETKSRIQGMTTKELEENLAFKRFNEEKAAFAKLELANRNKAVTIKTSKEHLKPIKSQTTATWCVVWLTVIIAILTALSLYVSCIRR